MQKVMQQVLMIMQVRWDTEDGTNTNTERGSILVITWKEDMVANISRKHVTATFSSKIDTIHSRNQPVTNLSSKQVMIVISNTTHYLVKLAGHLKKVLVVMGTHTTTSTWSLPAATSANRILLFLVGEGHHW